VIYCECKKDLHIMFIDMEKVYDREPRLGTSASGSLGGVRYPWN